MGRKKHKQMPVRFMLADVYESDVALCCPSCGCQQVHPREVMVEQGNTATHVTGDGTVVAATNRSERARGSLIGLRFFCENGCEFDYVFEFHKGTMGVAMSVGSNADDLSELWRD